MKSKSDEAIVLAYQLGYRANEAGEIFSPHGRKLSCNSPKKSGHLCNTFKLPGFNKRGYMSVLSHRFVAYCFFGEEVFKHELVRHLNDVPDDNRIENLKPGSYKDNRSDIPKEKLSANARANAHLLVERSRRLTDGDILLMRYLRETYQVPFAKLGECFRVASMTAYRACKGQSWGNVNES